MGGGQTEKQVQLIRDFKPRVIMVTPSYALNIVDEMERQGIDPRESSLEIGIFGAEPWTDGMRREIERRLGIDAVDIYGLSEVGGPGVANECLESKDGPTIWEDHFYPEIIDPESGEVLPDGEPGELVLDDADPAGAADDPLPHARPHAAPAAERALDAPHRQDRRALRRHADHPRRERLPEPGRGALARRSNGLAPHYQLVVEREGRTWTGCAVSVELRDGVSGTRGRVRSGVISPARIKSYVGVSARVDVVPPGGIERSLGKAKRVVDRRPPPA